MEKTKYPYLKQILKTTAKVALIAGVTYFFAAPFALGFTATLLNAMAAGQIAEAAVMCLGGYAAIKTAAKDIATMRERVQKQKREEHVDEELEDLKKDVKKINATKDTHSQIKQIQPQILHDENKQQKQAPEKKKTKWKINPLLFKDRIKKQDRAA